MEEKIKKFSTEEENEIREFGMFLRTLGIGLPQHLLYVLWLGLPVWREKRGSTSLNDAAEIIATVSDMMKDESSKQQPE